MGRVDQSLEYLILPLLSPRTTQADNGYAKVLEESEQFNMSVSYLRYQNLLETAVYESMRDGVRGQGVIPLSLRLYLLL